ncbi:MAG TPA: hypothetical protein VI942_01915 [Thermoanaerobaculia bacterium]|nr:hypothetical protein [Thermoanaerobaculia bacterium]
MRASGTDLPPGLQRDENLAFIPDRSMTAEQLRRLLAEGPEDRRAWAVTCLLLYAEWEEIWGFVTREQVIELFPQLDLPPALRAAWARILRFEEQPLAPTR